MHRPAALCPIVACALVVVLAGPAAAQDAGQVVKPTSSTSSTAGGSRLPAPTGVRVGQNEQGAILLTWSPVAGAVRYNLGRSVGTGGFRQAVPPTTTLTALVDRDVTVGVRHVYSVTPIDAQGVAGMRATSEVLVPSRPYVSETAADGAPPAPVNVAARVVGTNEIEVAWARSTATDVDRYDVRRDGVLLTSSTQNLYRQPQAVPGRYQFEIRAVDRNGVASAPSYSNWVTIAATAATDTSMGPSTGSGATSAGLAAEDAGGAVLVNVATPVVLRIGATQALAGVPRSGWTSLSPSIASVTADGTVSARAAGIAQLATVGTDASGAVRITVVRVRVTP